MDIFNFCWTTLLDESKKYGVFFNKKTCKKVQNNIDQNFSNRANIIAYLYKFGSYNITLFDQCFKEFFTKAPDSSKIIDDFLALKNLTICSMSCGPGTDIIGLLYSLNSVQKPLINPTTFKVFSRDGHWQKVVTEMIYSSIINVPDGSACHQIGGNYLKKLSVRGQRCLKTVNILLMCDSFSSCHKLKATIGLLQPGVLVFLTFSKEELINFKELDSFGSFLYGPVEVTLENMPYNEEISDFVGVKPIDSGRCMFAVWQKFPKTSLEVDVGKETENIFFSALIDRLSSIKLINDKCEVKDINSIQNISGLKSDFSSDTNISPSDSIASSSQFSSTGISSQIMKRRGKEPVVPHNSVDFNVQKTDFSENHFPSAKNASSLSLNASDSLVGKKCASSCKCSPKKGNDTNFRMKNLEGSINYQDSLKPCNIEEKQSSSSYQHCHQNQHQGHYIKSCQFNENSSTCCLHSSDNDVNVGTRNCSLSVTNNLYRTLPGGGPCLVIPIQNLSNESLSHILSIVSKNSSSVNKTSTLLPKKEKGLQL